MSRFKHRRAVLRRIGAGLGSAFALGAASACTPAGEAKTPGTPAIEPVEAIWLTEQPAFRAEAGPVSPAPTPPLFLDPAAEAPSAAPLSAL